MLQTQDKEILIFRAHKVDIMYRDESQRIRQQRSPQLKEQRSH